VRISRRLAVNLLAVLALGVVTVGWVVTQLIGASGLDQPFSVVADFKSTGGVFTNQEVAYRGVVVGKVGALELNDNDGVDIELRINPEWENEIPADVTASILSKSAVGEQFVNLTPMSDSDEMLADGDRIERSGTKLPVDFQQLLTSLDLVVGDVPVGRTARVVRNLAGGLRGKSDEIGSILKSLGRLSGTFASVAEEQQSLLDNATVAGSAFLRTKDEFSAAMRAADRVLAGIGDEPAELQDLFTSNDRFARAGIALLARHGRNLERGIRSLADFTEYQLANRDSLELTFDYLPDFLHAIEDASIPWETPDGRRFYLIRAGLVLELDEQSWPCKYELPLHWERYPHVREARKTNTDGICVDPAPSGEEVAALVKSLKAWDEEDDPNAILADYAPPLPGSAEAFIWPLDGMITSYFGPRDGRMHEGIDIDGEEGDPVVASASGVVAYAGAMDGYGNLVVIDHGGGLATAYAHLSQITVMPGDDVAQGGLVGAVGCTGHCTGSHLHFEVRIAGAAVDPLPYLPGGFIYTAPPDEPEVELEEPDTEEPEADEPDAEPTEEPEPTSSDRPKGRPGPRSSERPKPRRTSTPAPAPAPSGSPGVAAQ
jgi:virulence factor Mce-like protein